MCLTRLLSFCFPYPGQLSPCNGLTLPRVRNGNCEGGSPGVGKREEGGKLLLFEELGDVISEVHDVVDKGGVNPAVVKVPGLLPLSVVPGWCVLTTVR